MSGSNFCFLICIQVCQEAGLIFPFLYELSTVCSDTHSQRLQHSQWCRNFCGIPLLFSVIQWMLAGSSAFSKFSLNIWKFSVHILLEPDLKDFEHYLASMWICTSYFFTLLSLSYHASCYSTPIWPSVGVISTVSLLVVITSDFLFILLCTKPKIQLNFLVILYINKIKIFYILLSLDFVL